MFCILLYISYLEVWTDGDEFLNLASINVAALEYTKYNTYYSFIIIINNIYDNWSRYRYKAMQHKSFWNRNDITKYRKIIALSHSA